MRLPSDYRFTSVVKDRNHSIPRKRKIEKIREEEFGEELKEAVHDEESKTENKSNLSPGLRFRGF